MASTTQIPIKRYLFEVQVGVHSDHSQATSGGPTVTPNCFVICCEFAETVEVSELFACLDVPEVKTRDYSEEINRNTYDVIDVGIGKHHRLDNSRDELFHEKARASKTNGS